MNFLCERTNEWTNWKAALWARAATLRLSFFVIVRKPRRILPCDPVGVSWPLSSRRLLARFKRKEPEKENPGEQRSHPRAPHLSPYNDRRVKWEKFEKYRYIYAMETDDYERSEVLFFSGSRAFRSTISAVHSSSFKLGLRGAFSPATGVLFFSLSRPCVTLDRIFPCHARRGWQIYSS